MENLNYSELKIISYLTSEHTSIQPKKTLFKYRVRMAKFGEKYRGGKGPVACPLCKLHLDNQEMAFQCIEVNKSITVEGSPEELFQEVIKLGTIETIQKITELRKQRLECD